MSETGVRETERLSMIKVTSEQARKWGEELRRVVGVRERMIWRNPFATMESKTDSGARELLHGFEVGSRDGDPDLRAKAITVAMNWEKQFRMARNSANFKRLDEADPGYGAPSLAGEWDGDVEVPRLGVYGLGVNLGQFYLAEKSSLNYTGGLRGISTERGLMGEYRKQLVEARNPELLKVLDAVLVGIKYKRKKNG